MIYTMYDYLSKYSDTLSEIIALAEKDNYSFDYIEKTISYSIPFSNFENSNITDIAFSSSSKLYNQLFQNGKATLGEISIFGPAYWIGETYIRLFLKYRLSFEALFAYLPIEVMHSQFDLYHEMDDCQFYKYFESLLKDNLLSVFLKKKGMSAVSLANKSGISISTIRALKEGKRDLNKLQASFLEKIASCLGVKMKSLIRPLNLDIEEQN